MTDRTEATARPGALAPAEEARRLYRAAEGISSHSERARYLESLKSFLAYAEKHKAKLSEHAAETAQMLDATSVAFFHLSEIALAARAIELGLHLAPGSSSLQHHKATILLSQNRDLGEVLPLLDGALKGAPQDKAIWASKGDALKLLGRTDDAAEAYLQAQRLDATSMQYVDRALKLVPANSVALRMKLQLAKAHGGDQQALEACEALLAATPGDPELTLARSELLAQLGRLADALQGLGEMKEPNPETERRASFLRSKLLFQLGKAPEGLEGFRALVAGKGALEEGQLTDIAELAAHDGLDRALAVEARTKIHELDPRNLANLSALRVLAAETGRKDVAESACRAILEVSPNHLDAQRGLAELLLADGKIDEGLAAYEAMVETHPHEPAEIHRALEAARAADRPEIAERFARRLLEENPDDATAQEFVKERSEQKGDREGALTALDALVRAHPEEVRYLLEKKQLLEELGRHDELPPVLDELFVRDPTRSDLALERGNLHLQEAFDLPEGSAERETAARAAVVSYERSSLDPMLSDQSVLGIARAARLLDDPERAVKAYEDFLGRPANANRGEVHKELGHALRILNRFTAAAESYDRAVALGVEDADLLWGEVEVLSLINEDAKALRFVDLLVQREPANPLYLRRKGQLLLRLGRRPEGLATLKEAIDRAQGDPHVRFEVGEALRAQGAYQDAITYFREGLQAEPQSRHGRLALAETLALAGQFSDAIALIDGLLKEDPNDLGAWKARADAYRALGRPTEVAYSLRAVLLLDPHNSPALLEKYELHRQAGEKAEAQQSLGQLLASGGTESRDAGLWLAYGDRSVELAATEEANRAFERAAQLDPSKAVQIASRRARLRLKAGRPDLALELLETIPPEGRDTAFLLLRAEILSALERAPEALAGYEELLKREPGQVDAIAGYSRALLDQGRHADAKEFLRSAIPKTPPSEPLYLLLAEAEAGLGSIPEATNAIKRGVEVLPKSSGLWVRLGELCVAKELWSDASGAYAHALALSGGDPGLLTKAGFVAEKLDHPNEALAMYERATELAPTDKDAWCHRGRALLLTGRPDEARQAFERSLSLDSDYGPAKDGKKAALQKTREVQLDRHGRDALLLEAKLHRTVTKNDLFVTLHVPYDLLEPVLNALSLTPKIDLARLSETEMRDLETASYHLITAAFERRPEGIERRGLTLADVAVLSPPTATLEQMQRLFGYVRTVLEVDLRPENLKLTPDVEELARKALVLPEAQRTLFQLVRNLRVGLFKARLIKTVESAGAAVHAPLPSVDLGAYSPEFRASAVPPSPPAEGPAEVPGLAPEVPVPAATAHAAPHAIAHAGSASHATSVRCVGCGGIASITHDCGAPVCQQCVHEFHTCPKCHQPIALADLHSGGPALSVSTASPAHVSSTRSHASAAARAPAAAAHAIAHPIKAVLQRARHPIPRPADTATSAPKTPHPVVEPGRTPPSEEAPPEERPVPEQPARPPHPRERPDDEPRL